MIRIDRRVLYLLLAVLLVGAAEGLAGCGSGESGPAPGGSGPAAAEDPRGAVVFLGTSLTAGYGLPTEQAFPALIQQRLDAEKLGYRVVNAGVSGDTSAGGLRRLDWLLRLPVEVLVVELGSNDMLRGQDAASLVANLGKIIERTRATYPTARLVVAGMRAPPNLGARYVTAFEAVYPEIADTHGGVLIPFILDGVAGDASLNQADGIHPTEEGHRVLADTVWQALAPVLREGEP